MAFGAKLTPLAKVLGYYLSLERNLRQSVGYFASFKFSREYLVDNFFSTWMETWLDFQGQFRIKRRIEWWMRGLEMY